MLYINEDLEDVPSDVALDVTKERPVKESHLKTIEEKEEEG
jgi:hypothetical protein